MKVKLSFFPLFLLAVFFSGFAYATSPIRSWATDMYNQPNVKPMEEGSMQRFPVGSVTTEGLEITSNGLVNATAEEQPWMDFSPAGFRYNPDLTPPNPVDKSPESIASGAYLYGVYCEVCHGEDGKANTSVARLRGAPAINASVPQYSEGYLYVRITYGGNNLVSMPPFGYSTSEKERWEIVNYIKDAFK